MSVKTWSFDLQDRLSLLKPSTPRAIQSLVFTQKSFAFEMTHLPFQQSHSIIFGTLILQLLCLIGCYLLDLLPDYQATLPDFLFPQLRLHEPFLLPNAASRLSHLVLLSSCYICLANPDLDGPECQASPWTTCFSSFGAFLLLDTSIPFPTPITPCAFMPQTAQVNPKHQTQTQ